MKRLFLSLVAVVLVTFLMVSPASAQSDQSVASEPAVVSEAGEHELTITGAGFSGPAFLLPCPGAEGDVARVTEDDACDRNNLTPVGPDDDGNIAATEVTYDVPDEGLVLVISNADQSEAAATLVTVGEAVAVTTAAEVDADADDAAVTTTAAADDALASTGAESFKFIVIGATMLLAGLMLARFSRRVV